MGLLNGGLRNLTEITTIPDSGVSRWEFEDDSDTTTAIDSWNTEDGTINGATYTTDSNVGSNALSFDSVDDFVGEFTNSAYSFTSNFSIGAWVKPASNPTRNPVVNKGESRASADNTDYYVALGGGNVFADVSDGSNSLSNLQGSSVPTGSYTHIAMTYDGSTMVIYLDGSQDASGSISVSVQDAHNLRLGSGKSSAGTNYFDGIIDDPRVYSKALSATEVSNWVSTGSISG